MRNNGRGSRCSNITILRPRGKAPSNSSTRIIGSGGSHPRASSVVWTSEGSRLPESLKRVVLSNSVGDARPRPLHAGTGYSRGGARFLDAHQAFVEARVDQEQPHRHVVCRCISTSVAGSIVDSGPVAASGWAGSADGTGANQSSRR